MGTTEHLQTRDGAVPLYVALPDGVGPWPGVVVVHDAFGLTANTRRHVDWLASFGYLAAAPDLYSRGGKFTCARRAFRAIAERSGQAFEDIEAARSALAARSDCAGGVGIIGFCMGGGFALVAAVDRGFDVSSVNYGTVPQDAKDFLTGACPIVGSFGGKDPGLKGAARQLETALADNGVDHDVVEYPLASHCFLDQFSGIGGWLMTRVGFGYRPDEAADAKARIIRFFDAHLGRSDGSPVGRGIDF